jgi:hypothetical protein
MTRGAKQKCESAVQNESHKRPCSLFSIERRFPELDVAGSIPVSRSVLSTSWEYPCKSLPQFCRVNSQKLRLKPGDSIAAIEEQSLWLLGSLPHGQLMTQSGDLRLH